MSVYVNVRISKIVKVGLHTYATYTNCRTLFIMVLTMHEGGTPQSTSQALSVPAYVRKKALIPGKKLSALMPK